jgi:hypothetical protein
MELNSPMKAIWTIIIFVPHTVGTEVILYEPPLISQTAPNTFKILHNCAQETFWNWTHSKFYLVPKDKPNCNELIGYTVCNSQYHSEPCDILNHMKLTRSFSKLNTGTK